MAITARLPLVPAPDLAMAYAARLTNNLNLWEQTPAWRLFPCTYLFLLDFRVPPLCFYIQSQSIHSTISSIANILIANLPTMCV